MRDCVGVTRTVCAALSPTLRGFSSGLTGSDDAGSLSSPRATRAGGLTVTDARSAYGGASSAGGGLMGNHIGSRSDLVSTAQHLLHAGAASLTRRPMRAVLVEPGRDVWPLFYCSGLKGSANTALLERPPSSEACSGSVAAAVGARGGGGGGSDDAAGGGTLVGGGGYLRDCVGVTRTVCAALSPTLRGFSSGLTGSDDAASLSYPRATRACGLVAMDGRSVDGGASSVGGGPTGNRVGPRSDLVRTPQHLLYAGAASLTRRPMRAVLVELGRVVLPLPPISPRPPLIIRTVDQE